MASKTNDTTWQWEGFPDTIEECSETIVSLREENALLRGVLDVLRVDLQIKDDQIDKLYQSLRVKRKTQIASASCTALSTPTVSNVSSPLFTHSVQSQLRPSSSGTCTPTSHRLDAASPLLQPPNSSRTRMVVPVISLDSSEPMSSEAGDEHVHGCSSSKLHLLDRLNDDTLLLIFSYLSIPQNLGNRRVCRRFSLLSTSGMDPYWREGLVAIKGRLTQPKRSILVSSSFWRHELKWMGASGKPVVTTLSGHKGAVTCLSFASQNEKQFLVSGSDDGSLILWGMNEDKHTSSHLQQLDDDDMDTNKQQPPPMIMQHHHRQSRNGTINRLHSFTGHHGPVWGVSVDENLVCSGSFDKTVKVWDLSTGNCLHTLRGHLNWVSCVSLKENTIVSGSWDSTVRIWNVSGPVAQSQGTLPNEAGNAIYAIDRTAHLIVTGSHLSRFEVFDLERRQLVHSYSEAHKAKTYAVHFQTADVLATGGCDGKAKVWDLRQAEKLPTAILTGHTQAVMGVRMGDPCLSPYRVATCSGDHLVKIYDLRMFSQSFCDDDTLRWAFSHPSRASRIATLSAHSESVFALCMDESKLCSASADGSIRVFRF